MALKVSSGLPGESGRRSIKPHSFMPNRRMLGEVVVYPGFLKKAFSHVVIDSDRWYRASPEKISRVLAIEKGVLISLESLDRMVTSRSMGGTVEASVDTAGLSVKYQGKHYGNDIVSCFKGIRVTAQATGAEDLQARLIGECFGLIRQKLYDLLRDILDQKSPDQ